MKNLNHWFMGDDYLAISLLRYYVKINICQNDSFIYYQLEVIWQGKTILVFNFYSLNEATSFTENVIQKCMTSDEIVNSYCEAFNNNQFKKIKKS